MGKVQKKLLPHNTYKGKEVTNREGKGVENAGQEHIRVSNFLSILLLLFLRGATG